MKHIVLTFSEDGDDPETYVLEGDRRQSNQRMVQKALEKLLGEPVDFVDEEKRRYRTRETDKKLTIEDSRLLDRDEAKELKQEHFTLVINENVTENSCQVRYS